MAYNIYITKADTPEDSEFFPIEKEGLLEYIKTDLTLEFATEYEVQTEYGTTKFTGEVVLYKNENQQIVYFYEDGKLIFRGSKESIEKAKEIAYNLFAIVIGDEGEEY